MPRARRLSLSSYTSASRILIGSRAGSYVSALLRLAEILTRERLTSKPLDLYGAIVNERFSDVAFIEAERKDTSAGAAIFSIAAPSVSKLSVGLALTEQPLPVEGKLSARIVGLVSGPDRGAWKAQVLIQELVEVLTAESARSELLRCADPFNARKVLGDLASHIEAKESAKA